MDIFTQSGKRVRRIGASVAICIYTYCCISYAHDKQTTNNIFKDHIKSLDPIIFSDSKIVFILQGKVKQR